MINLEYQTMNPMGR